MASLLKGSLSSQGFVVAVAASGAAALEEADRFDPDVALIDITLGDGPTGVDIAYILHQSRPWIALLMLTKHADPRTAGVADGELPAGCGYLQKDRVKDTHGLLAVLTDQQVETDRTRSACNRSTGRVRLLNCAGSVNEPALGRSESQDKARANATQVPFNGWHNEVVTAPETEQAADGGVSSRPRASPSRWVSASRWTPHRSLRRRQRWAGGPCSSRRSGRPARSSSSRSSPWHSSPSARRVRVTVLIPAYNEEYSLPTTLAALGRQTRPPDRVIVIADNCTDTTATIARNMGHEAFETHENAHKKGGALNQALGLILPVTDALDVVLVMDADTSLGPRFIEVAAADLERDPELAAVGGVFFGEPGHGLIGQFQRNEYARYSLQIRARRGRVFVLTGTATMFRASALMDAAGARGVENSERILNTGIISTDIVHRSVRSSELSRNPAAVFAAAEEGPINITRRDGEDFVLSLASAVAQERRAVQIAADLMWASLDTYGAPLAERLRQPFPWIEFLTPEARDQFAEEIVSVTRACDAIAEFTRVLVVFDSWRSSAEAIARGYIPDGDLHWLAEPVDVPDPRLK